MDLSSRPFFQGCQEGPSFVERETCCFYAVLEMVASHSNSLNKDNACMFAATYLALLIFASK